VQLQGVVDRIAVAEPALVIVDYDGTLAPIVVDPEGAIPLPEGPGVLRALVASGVHVAVVSGRPVDYLLRHVAVEGVELVGQYGLERAIDGRAVADPRAEPWAGAVLAAGADLDVALPALYIERKAAIAVTVHWRAVGEIGADDLTTIDDIARRHGLAVHESRKARELRPPVDVDKGDAVERLLAEHRPAVAIFAGDDRGDLAAFAALDAATERGATHAVVKVGVLSPEAPPELVEAADVLVDGPAGVVALLAGITDARARAGSGATPPA
jgi:trehalose 6-phosphate phosphatase